MALLVSLPLAFLACGGDSETGGEDDEITRQIEGIAALAVGAYASSGPEALFDYLSENAAERCSVSALKDAFEGQTVPTGFREVKDVQAGADAATATVVVSTESGDAELSWTFVRNETSWRIDDMPGLENCRS
jgi:hypothetical protein